jgi:Family of unknown function (DUF6421)
MPTQPKLANVLFDESHSEAWTMRPDLVSEDVPPTESSRWAKDGRDLPTVDKPKELVDLVADDEFPLSLFYVQLQQKLAPALERRPARIG